MALVAGIALAEQPARAAQPSEVEDLIARAVELRKKGEDAKALPLLQRAHELGATPRTAAQLGLVETQLGYKLEAEAHLAEGLAAQGEPWIDRYRSVLETTLRQVRSQIGEVSVAGSPTGAVVTINGRERGRLPLAPVRLPAGPAKVALTADGYNDASATVVVRGGASERVTLNLSPLAITPRAAGEAPPKPAAPQPPNDESPPWSAGKVAGATLIGAGAASVATGATLLLFDKRETCDPGPGEACNRRTRTVAPGWSLIGAGAAALVVGGLLVYNAPSSSVTVGAGPSSLYVAGRF